jgi:hypothetical protein
MALRPIHAFDDHIRPAQLMLKLYRLLDSEEPVVDKGDLVDKMRGLVSAGADEDLLVVHHVMLTAVVRQRADLRAADLKRAALKSLLRQATVSACTALDAFLPALLRAHMPTILNHLGRGFFPSDTQVKDYFKEVSFSISDVLTFQERKPIEVAEAIANKMLSAASFKYLGSAKGIHIAGELLQLRKPWDALANHLGQDSESLRKTIDTTTKRRNDIVHRADRSSDDPDSEVQQEVDPSQARHGVDVINNVCHALDELVDRRIRALQATPAAATPEPSS